MKIKRSCEISPFRLIMSQKLGDQIDKKERSCKIIDFAVTGGLRRKRKIR